VEFDRGVLLATDSRFVYDGGAVVDTGRKLNVIEANVALVFAGDVGSAQRAISDLEAFVARRQRGSRLDMAKVTQQLLVQAYDKARARKRATRRSRLPPLRMLVGVYERRPERAHVITYSESNGFKPGGGTGIYAAGSDADVGALARALEWSAKATKTATCLMCTGGS
jgi:hypothetical protein